MSSSETPGLRQLNRAYVVLVPAASVSLIAYDYDFAWYLTAPTVLLWTVAIYFLWRSVKPGAD